MGRYLPSDVVERDGNQRIDEHRFDPLTGQTLVRRTVIRDGSVRRSNYFVRLFSFTELRDWLIAAGLSSVEGYGSDGEALTASSPRMLLVAYRTTPAVSGGHGTGTYSPGRGITGIDGCV